MSDSKNNKIIQELLDAEVTPASAIKAALAQQTKEKQEAKVREVRDNMQVIEREMQNAVRRLRMARKEESAAKKRVLKLNELQKQFFKDADWNAFKKGYNTL